MDWKRIAEAHGLPLSPPELDRLTTALSALEETFRPLLKDLTPDLEPDLELHLGEDFE
jgi:hypothetical protein